MAILGRGVLQGLGITLKTFVESYPAGKAVFKALRIPAGAGTITIEYPDIKQQHHERMRVFPFLVYDGTPDNLRCVSCKICEQECPPQCIHITGPVKDEQGRPLKVNGRTYPAKFDIDVAICMSCRICVDVCPFDAIEMDNEYEHAGETRFAKLVFNKEKLLKSNEYFHKIKPTEAAEVDARLAAKAKPAPKPAAPAAPVPSPAQAPLA